MCGESSRAPHEEHTCMRARGSTRAGGQAATLAVGDGGGPSSPPCVLGETLCLGSGSKDALRMVQSSQTRTPAVFFFFLAPFPYAPRVGSRATDSKPSGLPNLPRASRSRLPWRGGGAVGLRAQPGSWRGEEGGVGLPRQRQEPREAKGGGWWLGLSPSLGRGSWSVSGQSCRSIPGRAGGRAEGAGGGALPRLAFPGVTATALSPPPLQSVAAPPRARALRRQRLGARAPSPGRRRGARRRAAAREPRRGKGGRAEGGSRRGRRGRERRAR